MARSFSWMATEDGPARRRIPQWRAPVPAAPWLPHIRTSGARRRPAIARRWRSPDGPRGAPFPRSSRRGGARRPHRRSPPPASIDRRRGSTTAPRPGGGGPPLRESPEPVSARIQLASTHFGAERAGPGARGFAPGRGRLGHRVLLESPARDRWRPALPGSPSSQIRTSTSPSRSSATATWRTPQDALMFAERTTHVWGGGRVFAPCRQDEAQQPLVRRVSGRGRRARRDQRASKARVPASAPRPSTSRASTVSCRTSAPRGSVGEMVAARARAFATASAYRPSAMDARTAARIRVVCRRGRAQNPGSPRGRANTRRPDAMLGEKPSQIPASRYPAGGR